MSKNLAHAPPFGHAARVMGPWANWVTVALSAALVAVSGCGNGAGPASADDARLAQSQYELAADAFHNGRYRSALLHVEQTLEFDGEHADAAYLGAIVMLVFCASDEQSPDCRYAEAEKLARVAVEAAPNMRDAKNALGVILVHRQRHDDAIAVLEPLTRDMLYRSPEKAWGNLGWAYLDTGRHDDAIAALKRSIAAQPMFCVGHYRLGLAYEAKRDYAAARHAFTRAVTVPEGDCGRLQAAFWGRARVLAKLGMRAELRKDLQRCRELTKDTEIGRSCERKLKTLK